MSKVEVSIAHIQEQGFSWMTAPNLWSADCKGLLQRQHSTEHGQRILKHTNTESIMQWNNFSQKKKNKTKNPNGMGSEPKVSWPVGIALPQSHAAGQTYYVDFNSSIKEMRHTGFYSISGPSLRFESVSRQWSLTRRIRYASSFTVLFLDCCVCGV